MPSHTRAERAKKSTAKKSAPKKFIQTAIKTPGGLRINLRKKFNVKLPKGTNIPKSLIAKAAKLPPTSALNKLIRREANLAKTLDKLRPRKKK
ncbi:hypothetical protein LCGC14_1007360 [marine sediment metagenome]|uniref:Uncharacterized protein n=1 Tax=marine sediment metagenome TaxID=412755 RepID=A0A0F9N5Z0_9ZZZZ